MKRKLSPFKMLWIVLGALYFLVPLLATLHFSLQEGGGRLGLSA